MNNSNTQEYRKHHHDSTTRGLITVRRSRGGRITYGTGELGHSAPYSTYPGSGHQHDWQTCKGGPPGTSCYCSSILLRPQSLAPGLDSSGKWYRCTLISLLNYQYQSANYQSTLSIVYFVQGVIRHNTVYGICTYYLCMYVCMYAQLS
jgi:hypothetical protein